MPRGMALDALNRLNDIEILGLGPAGYPRRFIIDEDMNDIQVLNIQERLGEIQFLLGNAGNPFGDPMFARPPPYVAGQDAAAVSNPLDMGMFSRLFRNQQQTDNLNEQLMEAVDVHFEQAPEEEKKQETEVNLERSRVE